MKTRLTLICTFLLYINGIAQGFEWVKKGGGNQADYGRDIAIDNNDNIYVSGAYGYESSGTYNATFGSFTISNNSPAQNGYLAKYDSSGTVLWVKNITGPDRENAYQVSVDNNNNIYIAGEFETSVTIDGSTVNTTSPEGYGVYIAKFLSNGNLAWLKSLEPSVSITLSDIKADGSGNLFVTGCVGTNPQNLYVRKYAGTNGGLMSTIQSVNTGISDIRPEVINIDHSDNIIVSGCFGTQVSSISIGSLSFPSVSGFDEDIFVCKLNNSLSPTWLKTGGSNSSYDNSRGLAIDALNNIYLYSTTGDTVNWGGNQFIQTLGDFYQGYFTKFTPNGSELFTRGVPIALYGIGGGFQYPVVGDKLFFNVSFDDTVTIGNTNFISSGKDELIIVADTALNLLGAYEINSNSSYTASIEGFISNSNNDIFAGGSFRDLQTFGTIPLNTTGGNKSDMFLAKIVPCILPTLQISSNGAFNLCQGNSILLTAGTINNANYQWYQNNILIPNATASTYTVTQPGTYYSVASIGGACQTTSNGITISSSSINAQLQAQPNVTNICQGDEIQILTTSIFATYTWSNGQSGVSSITVEPGTYNVIVTDFSNCIDTAYITIGEYPLPPQPTILQSGCLLSSNITPANSHYKWFFDSNGNGYQIVGSDNSTYNATTTGDGFYKLEIKDENGCKNTSNPNSISGCGTLIDEEIKIETVRISPNPSNGLISINYTGLDIESKKILLYNSIGQIVGVYNFSNGYNQLNLNPITDGLYLYVVVIDNKQVLTGKLVITK